METLKNHDLSPKKWLWYNIMSDLKKQGGLDGVVIDPLSVKNYSCGGETKKGTRFSITWVHNSFLLVTMSQNETELIDAFAKVVEYKPFCQYQTELDGNILYTFEWDKKNPNKSFEELQKDENYKELKKIE